MGYRVNQTDELLKNEEDGSFNLLKSDSNFFNDNFNINNLNKEKFNNSDEVDNKKFTNNIILNKEDTKQNENYNLKINNINNQYKTRIGISTKDLIELTKEDLLDLILLINYSCSLTLEDHRYANSNFKKFIIEKNLNKEGYDILIDPNELKKLKIKKNDKETNNNQKFINNNNEGSYPSKEKNKMIKCKECDLVFNNIESMNEHYFSIHKKNKKEKEKKDIDIQFNKWAEERNKKNKNIDNNLKKNNENKKENKEEIKKEMIKKTNNKGNYEEEIKDNKIKNENNIKKGNKKRKKMKNMEDGKIDEIINDILDYNDVQKKKSDKKNKNLDEELLWEQALKSKDKKAESPLFYCEVCEKPFQTKNSLENHKIDKDHFVQIFNCKICNKIFQSEEAKEQHCKATKHNEMFCCKICEKYFNSEEAKAQHCKTKNHYEELYCKICKKAFSSVQSKDQHCKVKNHYDDFYCEICDKIFSSIEAKEQHCKTKKH